MPPFAQLETLKDTPFFVPFAIVAALLYFLKLFYDWVRTTTKAEIAEAVSRLESEMQALRIKVEALENSNRAAVGHLLLAVNDLPQIPENNETRHHLERAIGALNRTSGHGGNTP